MHRPILPRTLLWAKIGVVVQVSLWLAGAFNLCGLYIGTTLHDGSWLFLPAHALTTALEALFTTSFVVVVYQLCLRWCGRERLDGLMTMAQIFIAIAAVLGGQLVPQLLMRFHGSIKFNFESWWVGLLPPAWFAGLDDAIAGSGAPGSWLLAGIGLTTTAILLWLAFGKLARDYETGLQSMNESTATRPGRAGHRRWIETLVMMPPLRWWLRDSVERASFVLTAAYLFRDRDVKLRIYPGLAPMMVMPFIFLLQEKNRSAGHPEGGGFGVAFSGAYLGLIPMLALNILRFSQQWQAADLFRAVPIAGPSPLCHGARRAVLVFLTLPMLLIFALLAWLLAGDSSHLPLLLPGIIALPVYALIPCLGGRAVPFAVSTEAAKAAGRSMSMFVVMFISMGLAGLALWTWNMGWFDRFLVAEAMVVAGVYYAMRRSLESVPWPSME
jgi:hypothetical protein